MNLSGLNALVFTDAYMSDLSRVLTDKVKSSMYWDKNAIRESEDVLHFKFEDVLIDTEWGLVNLLREKRLVTTSALSNLINIIQNKETKKLSTAFELRTDEYWSGEGLTLIRSLNPLDIVTRSPVHRLVFQYIQSLEAVDYPYFIVCQHHKSFLRHKLSTVLTPTKVMQVTSSGVKTTALISDDIKDKPSILMARPWNLDQVKNFKGNTLSFF